MLKYENLIFALSRIVPLLHIFLTAATVEFAQRQYFVLENGVSVTVTLNLTGILDQNTTVRYV